MNTWEMKEQAFSQRVVEEGVQASFWFEEERALASRGDIPTDEIVGSGKNVVENSIQRAGGEGGMGVSTTISRHQRAKDEDDG